MVNSECRRMLRLRMLRQEVLRKPVGVVREDTRLVSVREEDAGTEVSDGGCRCSEGRFIQGFLNFGSGSSICNEGEIGT